MTPPGLGPGLIEQPAQRGKADVLFVSLGTTLGLQVADAQFVDGLRAAGASVEVVHVPPKGRNVRTLMLTDFVQAWVSRVATNAALGRIEPRAVVYSTTTAALFGPRRGAIRFDALAQRSRPGRHGVWQRPLERWRLRRAPVLLPWGAGSLDGAPAAAVESAIVVPVAIAAPVAGAADGLADAFLAARAAAGARPVAVTYAPDASKKGLDRLLAAWSQARREGEELLVTGRDALPDDLAGADGVHCTGRFDPGTFRGVVERVGVFAIAPRREDYGLVQLEALAAGARVVTTAAPGPYAALPLLRERWPAQVVDDADDPVALAAALRGAIDARAAEDATGNDADRAAARAVVAPWAADAVRAQISAEVIPALLGDLPSEAG